MINSIFFKLKAELFKILYKSLLIIITASLTVSSLSTPLLKIISILIKCPQMCHVFSCFHVIKHGGTTTWNSLSSSLPGHVPLIHYTRVWKYLLQEDLPDIYPLPFPKLSFGLSITILCFHGALRKTTIRAFLAWCYFLLLFADNFSVSLY